MHYSCFTPLNVPENQNDLDHPYLESAIALSDSYNIWLRVLYQIYIDQARGRGQYKFLYSMMQQLIYTMLSGCAHACQMCGKMNVINIT